MGACTHSTASGRGFGILRTIVGCGIRIVLRVCRIVASYWLCIILLLLIIRRVIGVLGIVAFIVPTGRISRGGGIVIVMCAFIVRWVAGCVAGFWI